MNVLFYGTLCKDCWILLFGQIVSITDASEAVLFLYFYVQLVHPQFSLLKYEFQFNACKVISVSTNSSDYSLRRKQLNLMKKTWFYNIWESRFNGGSSLWLCVFVVFYLWTCRTSVLTQPRSCTIGKTSFTVQLSLCIVSTINSATRLVKQKKPQHCTYKINQANQTLKKPIKLYL